MTAAQYPAYCNAPRDSDDAVAHMGVVISLGSAETLSSETRRPLIQSWSNTQVNSCPYLAVAMCTLGDLHW